MTLTLRCRTRSVKTVVTSNSLLAGMEWRVGVRLANKAQLCKELD